MKFWGLSLGKHHFFVENIWKIGQKMEILKKIARESFFPKILKNMKELAQTFILSIIVV